MLQEPLRAAHGDLFIKWAGLAREIVVGREMDNRGDTVPIGNSDTLESALDASRCQVDAYPFCGWWRCVGRQSKLTSEKWPANLLISAASMKPLLSVTTTTPGLVIKASCKRLKNANAWAI